MIGLDTNVLVRYLVQDDPGQSRQASRRPTCEIPGTQSVTSSGPFNSSVNGRDGSAVRKRRTRSTLRPSRAQATSP